MDSCEISNDSRERETGIETYSEVLMSIVRHNSEDLVFMSDRIDQVSNVRSTPLEIIQGKGQRESRRAVPRVETHRRSARISSSL